MAAAASGTLIQLCTVPGLLPRSPVVPLYHQSNDQSHVVVTIADLEKMVGGSSDISGMLSLLALGELGLLTLCNGQTGLDTERVEAIINTGARPNEATRLFSSNPEKVIKWMDKTLFHEMRRLEGGHSSPSWATGAKRPIGKDAEQQPAPKKVKNDPPPAAAAAASAGPVTRSNSGSLPPKPATAAVVPTEMGHAFATSWPKSALQMCQRLEAKQWPFPCSFKFLLAHVSTVQDRAKNANFCWGCGHKRHAPTAKCCDQCGRQH